MVLSGVNENLKELKGVEDFIRKVGYAVVVRIIGRSRINQIENNRFVFNPDENFVGEFKGAYDWLLEFYRSKEKSKIGEFADEEGSVYTFVTERVVGRLTLYIFGAGHVGQAVALMGALLGYEIIVVDDRAEFLSRERLPDTRIKLITSEFDKVIDDLRFGYQTAAVIVTRGHQYDEMCLRKLLRLRMSYLGMIGSKRRVLSVFNKLKSEGFKAEEFARVHAPIGLVIGARSPQEIAVSILGEIIAEVNK